MNSFKHISGKKILITGNTGFKGSWLTFFLKYLGCKVYGISDEDYEGIYKLSKTKDLLEKQYYFDLTKISSKEIENLLKEISPNIVFHFAAQSLVKRPLWPEFTTNKYMNALNDFINRKRRFGGD